MVKRWLRGFNCTYKQQLRDNEAARCVEVKLAIFFYCVDRDRMMEETRFLFEQTLSLREKKGVGWCCTVIDGVCLFGVVMYLVLRRCAFAKISRSSIRS